MANIRKPNLVYELAHWFVTEFLGQEWDSRSSGMHLRHATMLLKPKVDKDGNIPTSYTIDEVKTCLRAMESDVLGSWRNHTISTLLAVTYGTPPFISRIDNIRDYLPPEPPIYETLSNQQWHITYGYLLGEKDGE
jgi:hypothetical protein